MNILVACEESQAVCKEFRKPGYEALEKQLFSLKIDTEPKPNFDTFKRYDLCEKCWCKIIDYLRGGKLNV